VISTHVKIPDVELDQKKEPLSWTFGIADGPNPGPNVHRIPDMVAVVMKCTSLQG
jgi:hypothetical protein